MNASARAALIGREPVVERDPGRLVLDEQPGARRREARRPRSRTSSSPIGTLSGSARAVGELQLQPVRAGKGDAARAADAARDRPSARPLTIASRPSSRCRSRSSSGRERRRDADRVRRVGELDQGAVEIEEQGGAVEQSTRAAAEARPCALRWRSAAKSSSRSFAIRPHRRDSSKMVVSSDRIPV